MEPIFFIVLGLGFSTLGSCVALVPNLKKEHWLGQENPEKHAQWKWIISIVGTKIKCLPSV